ncbi:endonuclease domain of the non-LTR retrotransposon LINE-1 [Elysia marginata]|uniref:Endonuclease domain of the non-LTR retrotransposon LINE-1 n=1 Tax=Elysia marginata TaxID=1093978 RepID=A0AAV4JUT0_9GAST|nr:endonuclease domain of the non-LTR retrotransposon LINE-1 [Elysia marginata]
MESQHPDALKIVTGVFNHCDAATALSALPLQQEVNRPTRGEKTLDLFLVNVNNVYSCHNPPLSGRSDHNLVLLRPTCRPMTLRVHPKET